MFIVLSKAIKQIASTRYMYVTYNETLFSR